MTTRGRRALLSTIASMTPEQVAWVAGIVEGEGSMQGTTGALDLWNNDRALLERLQTTSGVGLIYHVPLSPHRIKHGTRSDSYRWRVTRHNDLVALYTALLPWMMPERAVVMQQTIERYTDE